MFVKESCWGLFWADTENQLSKFPVIVLTTQPTVQQTDGS